MSEQPHPLEAQIAARKRVDDANRKAEAQAAEDSQVVKAEVEINLKPGRTVTLAEANALAERNNQTTNDIAHNAAVQVARVTKDVLKGVGAGSAQHKRIARAHATGEKQAAATAKAETE